MPSAPASVTLNTGLGNDSFFDITLTIDGSKLPDNAMNSGSNGANGDALTLNEYDGYLVLDNGDGHVINIPWHVLPRKAANVVPDTTTFAPGSFPASIGLDNQGVGTAQNDAYALLATSPAIPSAARNASAATVARTAIARTVRPAPAPSGARPGRATAPRRIQTC